MKIAIPAPAARHYKAVHNNIKVDGGVVGSINTGEVGKIAVAIGDVRQGGNEELATALAAFVDRVVADDKLSNEQKRDVVDQLGYVSTQLTAPAAGRKPGLLKAILEGLEKAIVASTSLVTLWEKLSPLLHHALK